MVPRPATMPVITPSSAGFAVAPPLHQHPGQRAGRRAQVRAQHRHGGGAVGGQCAAAVEAEPAHPQHAGAGRRQRQAVRRHRHMRKAAAPADAPARTPAPPRRHSRAPRCRRRNPSRPASPASRRPRPSAPPARTPAAATARVNHSTTEKRMRSAKPPITSAGVMMAKVIWNMANSDSGMRARPARRAPCRRGTRDRGRR